RAAVDLGAGFLSDGWTTETYSFTYQDDQEIPSWFQTTQAQFESDIYTGLNVNATNGGEVVPMNGGNVGTITSTPIHFASVQDAVSYGTFEWNQTPGSGSLKFDIQGSSDGGNFSNIPEYTGMEEADPGLQIGRASCRERVG